MADIYEQHDAAFKSVAAYVITNRKGERVATVAFKYASSGLRTTCFFHILGSQMVKAFAGGGGYDKASSAIHEAARRAKMRDQHDREPQADYKRASDEFERIRSSVTDSGNSWDRELRDAGFNVLQAV